MRTEEEILQKINDLARIRRTCYSDAMSGHFDPPNPEGQKITGQIGILLWAINREYIETENCRYYCIER